MRRGSRRVLVVAAASLAIAVPYLAWAPPRGPSGLFRGEYGLFVQATRDSIVVHWITAEVDSGVLAVLADGRAVQEARTAPAQEHRVAFRRPRAKLLTLAYGGRETDTTVISLDEPSRPRAVVRGVDSVFVVSDLHGQFASFALLLTRAGVLDDALRWKAGGAHLVLVGDIFDRGPDATRLWWLIYRLEREAEAAGGAVHVLLGNHEIMTFVGDLRYLSPKESLVADYHRTCYPCLYDLRTSILGRWLASKPAVVQINDAVYVHGGLTPGYAELGIAGLNDAVYRYLREPVFLHLMEGAGAAQQFGRKLYDRRYGFFFNQDSPFWFRGYVLSDTLGAQLDSVLTRLRVGMQVVGHTPLKTVASRYGGKLYAVNVVDFGTELLLLDYSRGGGGHRAARINVRGERSEF